MNRTSVVMVLAVLMVTCQQDEGEFTEPFEDPSEWSSRISRLDEARTLFVETIVTPLENWTFDSTNQRYVASHRASQEALGQEPGQKESAFEWRLSSFEVRDLQWSVEKARGVGFEGKVQFTSTAEFYSGEAPMVHQHAHRYRLDGTRWQLSGQEYRDRGHHAPCLVGHLKCDLWNLEAVCVDEAQRLRDLKD